MDEYLYGWIKKVSIVVIIMMLMCNITLAANEKVDTGKVVDKTKETAKTISNVPKELQNKIKVKDSDTSKYKVEKTDKNSIKITKDEVVGEHTKTEVSVDTAYLTELDKQANGDGYIGYMRKVDGQVTDVQKIRISDISSGGTSTIPATFSEVIVSGFSGTRTTTFNNVTSGQILNIQDASPDAVTVSVSGAVPSYVSGIPTSGIQALYLLRSDANDSSGKGRHGTAYNISYANGSAYFRGDKSYISLPTSLQQPYSDLTILAVTSTLSNTTDQSIFDTGYTSAGAFGGIELQYRTSSRCRVFLGNGTSYSDVYTTSTKIPFKHMIAYRRNQTTRTYNLYENLNSISTGTTLKGNIAYANTRVFLGSASWGTGSAYSYTGHMQDVAIYNQSLSLSQISQYYAGGSGVSFQPEPSYNFTGYDVSSGVAKTLDIDSTITGIEVVNTAGTSLSSVTVVEYFTENTTKIMEYNDSTSHYINTNLTCPYTVTNGSFNYTIPQSVNGYTKYNDPLLVSNNPNATVVRDGYKVTVYTGYMPTNTERYYNIIVSYIEGNTEIDNTFIDTYRVLSDDIDNAFVLSGVLFTVCVGITILALLAGILTGSIDYKVSVITIGILVVSEIVILVGIIIISALFEGLI